MPAAPYSHPLRVTNLNSRKTNVVTLEPDKAARARIAEDLGIEALPAARLDARIEATGNDAWELTGRLSARVVQACVITLAPVETVIDETLRRVYSPHTAQPDAAETEIQMTDDEIELLGQVIDAGAVLTEALALALPPYPRAPGAALPEDAPGDSADDADERRPFAGLAALLARKDEG